MTISAAFGKPFAYQVAAFRLRLGNLVGTATWKDIWQAEHDRAFVVAGAMKADLLADLAGAVDKAVSNGGTLEEFRRDFRKIVAERGWHGWTGEGTKAGEAWRTKVIYRTNMATSYAAGRYAQLTEGNYPFWVYFHGNSREARLQHLAWHGLILPPDHPFWATHFPPNGWGCTCFVSGARSMEAALRRGGKADVTLPSNWAVLNTKTGAPEGISKGWAYAPGRSTATLVATMVPKLDALPASPSIDLIQNWLKLDAFSDWMKAPMGLWPVARISEHDATAIQSNKLVASLSAETVAKQQREHPELSTLDYLMIQRTIDQATIRVQDTAKSMIFVFEDPEAAGYVLVVKATQTGEGLFVTSFRRLSADMVKRDETIRRLLRKVEK